MGTAATATAMTRFPRLGSLALFACLLVGWAGPSPADPSRYEPGLDPLVGVHLVSWSDLGPAGAAAWESAVQDVYDHGLRAVAISPVRFVDPATGHLRLSDGTTSLPPDGAIEAALARAALLGLTVTLDPFVEPDGFAFWRGDLTFSGSAADAFWADYGAYVLDMASLAETYGAARMTVGTELRALARDPANAGRWTALIEAVRQVFSGQLGYAANWDDFADETITTTFWEHPAIDFVGVDLYAPLVSPAVAAGRGQPSVATLESAWNAIFDDHVGPGVPGLLAFAAARKGGLGMPCVVVEHGSVPYDKTSAAPFRAQPGRGIPDPWEQRNDYQALLAAADLRAEVPASSGRLEAIYFWHWGMPGADGSPWYLDPEGDPVEQGAKAAAFLAGFASGDVPEPGFPQSRGQRRCIDSLNAGLAKLIQIGARQHVACLRDAAADRLGPQSLEECATADRRGKLAQAKARLERDSQRWCSAFPPSFGATDPATVAQAASAASLDFAHALLGTPLASAGAPSAWRCRERLFRAAVKCLLVRVKEFRRCARTGLEATVDTAGALASACLGADPKERIAKQCGAGGPISRAIARDCVQAGADLATSLPGCSPGDPTAAYSCAADAARLAACRAATQADGLPAACN
ncbi:MAG: hypothetical protein D6815_07885 [Candidatus Dadabacteria bacterium]|nr:MAG: hypothetical protein D6815_07885 [Candidatus Dadabacteria bacterium]